MNFADEYADLEWVQSTPDADLAIWPVTTPAPDGAGVADRQRRLDAFAGFSGASRNVRFVWAGNLFVTIDGRERLQYAYPWVSQGLARVVRRAVTDADGAPMMTRRPVFEGGYPVVDDDGCPVTEEVSLVQEVELPMDERDWEPEFESLKGLPFGVKSYVIEKAIEAWAIQALVPARGDVTGPTYELVRWCTEDGTELGRPREVVDADVDAVKDLWDERSRALRHRHDQEAAPEFWRRRASARLARILTRRRAAAAKFGRHADDVSRAVWGRYLGVAPVSSLQTR